MIGALYRVYLVAFVSFYLIHSFHFVEAASPSNIV
jgi:hypothetical protein